MGSFRSVGVAYVLWFFFGVFGAHRFYTGHKKSAVVWACTGGLFIVGWLVDFFMVAQMVESHNKRVFHQGMVEAGNSLLFESEYTAVPAANPYAAPFGSNQPFAQQPYYPQPVFGSNSGGRGADNGGFY